MDISQQNVAKSYLYMALLTGLVAYAGYIISENMGYGSAGLGVGLVISGLLNFVSYYFSDKIVLAQSRAQEIKETDSPELYAVVQDLTRRADLPMPKVYIIPDGSMNAFATGRDHNHASVAVTAGLLQQLNKEELSGVIAHELAHVKNYDIRLMSVVSVLVGFLNILSNMFWRSSMYGHSSNRDDNRAGNVLALLLVFVTPIVGMLIQFAISRQREFVADATGARIAGSAQGLISAITKLEQGSRIQLATADISTSHLYIANPFGANSLFFKLFSTHPPMYERIAQLSQLRV